MSKNEFKHYIAQSVLNMMALSNDGHSTSLELFKSYVNDTDSDLQLRCSAIRAIGRYEFSEVNTSNCIIQTLKSSYIIIEIKT